MGRGQVQCVADDLDKCRLVWDRYQPGQELLGMPLARGFGVADLVCVVDFPLICGARARVSVCARVRV